MAMGKLGKVSVLKDYKTFNNFARLHILLMNEFPLGNGLVN